MYQCSYMFPVFKEKESNLGQQQSLLVTVLRPNVVTDFILKELEVLKVPSTRFSL